jgi:site-specific DNA-methyltransferase (adenine-specific)
VNELHYGDNLERLRNHIPDEVADLVYLDPPFNSARNYNLLFKQHKGQDSPAQIMAFEDTWQWSHRENQRFRDDDRNQPLWKLVASLYEILGDSEMMAYIVMMAPRLLELHRKLKPTGPLYLHCDPAASHYLKIILDVVFEPQHYRNEVVWKRTSAHNDSSKRFGNVHDILLYYAKSDRTEWHPVYEPYSDEYVALHYVHEDPDGRKFRRVDLRSPNPRPNLTYDYTASNGLTYKPHANGWAVSREVMKRLDREGRLFFPAKGEEGRLRRKLYLDEVSGTRAGDVWTDIKPIFSVASERRGYPTQKPLALLERIIAASSEIGQVVLDPFAGCGTAIVAAERMGRSWIGIDITYLAINEIVDRLNEEKREGHALNYTLKGTPKDESSAIALFESTRDQNHKPFEQWAVTLVGGRYNDKRGADRGIDGRIPLWAMDGTYREGLIQVKGGNALNLGTVRDFGHVIESNKAVFGIMIAQREPTKEMRLVAEQMGLADWPGSREIPRYQILTTQSILEQGKRPVIPEGYRVAPQTGVGKAQTAGQEELFNE